MNKLILSHLTIVNGEIYKNREGATCFRGLGSFREAYGECTLRHIPLLAYGKAAERLEGVAIGSRLEAQGKYRSETKDLNGGGKAYLYFFVIGKITRVGKSSETEEAGQREAASLPTHAPAPVAERNVAPKAVTPIYKPEPSASRTPEYDDIPF
jgi:hypothetical protein